MEEPLEQKQEDLDDMSMLTEKELLLKESNLDQEDISQAVLIEACEEGTDNCPKCHSSDIDRIYIDGHNVVHCICRQCWREWVE